MEQMEEDFVKIPEERFLEFTELENKLAESEARNHVLTASLDSLNQSVALYEARYKRDGERVAKLYKEIQTLEYTVKKKEEEIQKQGYAMQTARRELDNAQYHMDNFENHLLKMMTKIEKMSWYSFSRNKLLKQ